MGGAGVGGGGGERQRVEARESEKVGGGLSQGPTDSMAQSLAAWWRHKYNWETVISLLNLYSNVTSSKGLFLQFMY